MFSPFYRVASDRHSWPKHRPTMDGVASGFMIGLLVTASHAIFSMALVDPGDSDDLESWSNCSKSCDYGLQTRRRRTGPSEDLFIDVRLCNEYNCQELTEEIDKGIVIVLHSEASTAFKVVKYTETIINILRNHVNDLCRENASLCCQQPTSRNMSKSVDFVKDNDIYVPRGFPSLRDHENVYLKVIAIVDKDAASSVCKWRRNTSETKSTGIPYLPSDVLDQALSRCASFITKETGLNVLKVVHPETPPTDWPNDSNSEESTSVGKVVAATLVPLIVIVFGIIICVRRYRK